MTKLHVQLACYKITFLHNNLETLQSLSLLGTDKPYFVVRNGKHNKFTKKKTSMFELKMAIG